MKTEVFENHLVEFFSTVYSGPVARKLAKSHAVAHEQFIGSLWDKFGAARRNGITFEAPPGPPEKIKCRRVVTTRSKSPKASLEHVYSELSSLIQSMGRPVKMSEIVEALNGFGWTTPQLKTSVKTLKESGKLKQNGLKRGATYDLLDSDVGTLETEPLSASDSGDEQADQGDAASDGEA